MNSLLRLSGLLPAVPAIGYHRHPPLDMFNCQQSQPFRVGVVDKIAFIPSIPIVLSAFYSYPISGALAASKSG